MSCADVNYVFYHIKFIEREPRGVNLAGKVKNLFLVTIDVGIQARK